MPPNESNITSDGDGHAEQVGFLAVWVGELGFFKLLRRLRIIAIHIGRTGLRYAVVLIIASANEKNTTV